MLDGFFIVSEDDFYTRNLMASSFSTNIQRRFIFKTSCLMFPQKSPEPQVKLSCFHPAGPRFTLGRVSCVEVTLPGATQAAGPAGWFQVLDLRILVSQKTSDMQSAYINLYNIPVKVDHEKLRDSRFAFLSIGTGASWNPIDLKPDLSWVFLLIPSGARALAMGVNCSTGDRGTSDWWSTSRWSSKKHRPSLSSDCRGPRIESICISYSWGNVEKDRKRPRESGSSLWYAQLTHLFNHFANEISHDFARILDLNPELALPKFLIPQFV